MTRAVFFGTPAPAVPALWALAEGAEAVLVVTRPDRPRGRSGRPRPPPVKQAAGDLGIRVAQPERLRGLVPELEELKPEVGVVVAFGSLLPPEILALFPAGLINVHFSLLPRWRGAAPVARAILAGDEGTGVSLMRLDEGLDTGPVIATAETPIFPDETAGELTERLARMGAALLRVTLPRYLSGEIAPRPQDHDKAIYAEKLAVEEARLSLSSEPDHFCRRVRGFNPRPGAWLEVQDLRLKIWRARPAVGQLQPGDWEVEDDRLILGLDNGSVHLEEVQPAGRRRMRGAEWARGWQGPGPRTS